MKIAICLTLACTYRALIDTHAYTFSCKQSLYEDKSIFLMNIKSEKPNSFVKLLVEVCLRSSRLTSFLTRGFSLLTFHYIIKWTALDILIQTERVADVYIHSVSGL